jgi:hypothetical protein
MDDKHSDAGLENARSIVIEGWMRMVLATGGIERFDDLHIGKIDLAWRGRESAHRNATRIVAQGEAEDTFFKLDTFIERLSCRRYRPARRNSIYLGPPSPCAASCTFLR